MKSNRKLLGQYQKTISSGLHKLFIQTFNLHVYNIDLIEIKESELYKLQISDIDFDMNPEIEALIGRNILKGRSSKDNVQKIKNYIDKNFNFKFLNLYEEKETDKTGNGIKTTVEYELNEEQLEILMVYCKMLTNT